MTNLKLESYVTAKIQNRYADEVTINIQGGQPGIELQESLFKIKDHEKGESPILCIPINKTDTNYKLVKYL